MTIGKPKKSIEQAIEIVNAESRRQRERQQGGTRLRTHRGKVAQVYGQRAMPDRVRRHEAAIEVDPFDLRIDCQDVVRTSRCGNHGGIIAGSDDDPRWPCDPGAQALDQRTFAEIRDSVW